MLSKKARKPMEPSTKLAACPPTQGPSAAPSMGHMPTTASKKQGGKAAGKVVALSPATGAATSATKGPSVQWDTDPAHTDKLVTWILNHPADHNILFHDHLSNTPPPTLSPENKPSRKNKKDVTAVIAKYIFQDDQVYSTLYASDAGKFAMSVTNRLSM